MKSKLVKQQEHAVESNPGLDIEAILQEKYAAAKVPATEPRVRIVTQSTARTNSEPQEKAAVAPRKRDVVRVSVDFPRSLYNEVVAESDLLEQTMREFMLTLVRQHFAQQMKNAN